jgi:hypothetical protein
LQILVCLTYANVLPIMIAQFIGLNSGLDGLVDFSPHCLRPICHDKIINKDVCITGSFDIMNIDVCTVTGYMLKAGKK